MDKFTKNVKATQDKLVELINNCGLPPVVIDLILRNLLEQIQRIEMTIEKPVDRAVEGKDGTDNNNESAA